MTTWTTRKDLARFLPKIQRAPKPVENGAQQIVLSTFAKGRIYTAEDVRLRCKDRGHTLHPEAIRAALRSLMVSRHIVSLDNPSRKARGCGDLKETRIYALAESDKKAKR